MDIIGLGTIAMDMILQVNVLPKEDGFSLVKEKSFLDGGSGANVVVQASRLGAECGFIAQIGDDEIGCKIKEGLDKENVDISNMISKKSGTSLHTIIVVGEEGKKFILLQTGDTFMSLDRDQVNLDFIKSAKIFYTDLLPGNPAIYALKEAKKAGLKTVFNLQIGLPLMEQFGIEKSEIMRALIDVDVFAPCREAFTQLTGTEDYSEGIRKFKESFKGLLLLTLGSEGSMAMLDRQIIRVPVHPVEVKDTTGAGDSYIGAFMYAYYIRHMDLKNAMEFSSVCAALTCTGVGARTSPQISSVEEIMQVKNSQDGVAVL